MRLAVRQHLHALDDAQSELVYHNAATGAPRWLRWLRPDLVVLHTTFLGIRWFQDFERYRRDYAWLADVDCPKVALPQDEYDHSAVLEQWLVELGATHVFSCFDGERRRILYPSLDDRLPFTETLTGFVDRADADAVARRSVPAAERPKDVVYRATKLPYWFGSHGQLKHGIAEAVASMAAARGLRTDISTRWEDTVFGTHWLDFIMSGRTTIGAESGSSVLDPDGAIQARIRQLVARDPELTFAEVDRLMPAGWDAYAFFAISPRHLEAVVTKTCQVLVDGAYSGVLEPGRHFISLRRDFSNLDEVLEQVADVAACAEIADRAHEEVLSRSDVYIERFAEDILRAAGRPRTVQPRLPVGVLQRARLPVAPRLDPKARLTVEIWALLVRTLISHPSLSVLVRKQRVMPRRLVGDVLRLGIVDRLRRDADTRGAPWRIRAAIEGGTLVLRTEPGTDRARPAGPEPFTAVEWDHSAVGIAAPVTRWDGPPVIGVGDRGRYVFAELCSLADGDPARLRRALREFSFV